MSTNTKLITMTDLNPYPGNLKHHKVEKEEQHKPLLSEAARAKDAELIQRLVDGLQQIADEGHWTPDMHELLNIAAAAGFKPSEP